MFTLSAKDQTNSVDEFVSSDQVEKLLKDRYEAERKRKENLDKKANNLLVGATTTVAIYGGFGILAESNFFNNSSLADSTLIPLILGLSALIIGIIFSIISISLRKYWIVINLDDFGSITNDKFTKSNKVDEFRKTDPTLFNAMTINGYIEYGLRNKEINDSKAQWIIVSQILFIIGIASIPAYLIFLKL